MFLWEQFRDLVPKPVEYLAMVLGEVVVLQMFRAWALRLIQVKQLPTIPWLNWLTRRRVSISGLIVILLGAFQRLNYLRKKDQPDTLRGSSCKGPGQLEIVASSLLPWKLVSRECGAIYNPLRVLRQLDFDHGTITITGELAASSALVIDAKDS